MLGVIITLAAVAAIAYFVIKNYYPPIILLIIGLILLLIAGLTGTPPVGAKTSTHFFGFDLAQAFTDLMKSRLPGLGLNIMAIAGFSFYMNKIGASKALVKLCIKPLAAIRSPYLLLAVTYIVGQLSSPIEQLIDFSRSLQDAKISLERLGEIHGKEDEEQAGGIRLNVLPDDRTLRLENLSFSYDGADRDYVLEDINLTIPHNRVTAIVGASGSGKTTIVKLLLGFYNPNKGDVRIGDTSLKNLNPHVWRSKTGSVMQDGFIFSDTIANNIAPGEEMVDKERLLHAVRVANIRDFIDSLPLGYNTKIGMEGNGEPRAETAYPDRPGGVQESRLHLPGRGHERLGRQQRAGDHGAVARLLQRTDGGGRGASAKHGT